MERKTIGKISTVLIILFMILYFLSKTHLIQMPDIGWVFLIIILIIAIAIPIFIQHKILKKGGPEAEQIKKEIEGQKKQTEKGLWIRFIIMSIGGLLTVSLIIIQFNSIYNKLNITHINQNEFIQKIIGIDIGISFMIIAGFWLCYIFVEKKKQLKQNPMFDAFEETKMNTKIPGSMILIGLIITLLSIIFL
jgi:hypothetical protein